jgi:hypothetical protein
LRPARIEVLYEILSEFCVYTELIRLNKLRIEETYSKVHTGKNLSYSE